MCQALSPVSLIWENISPEFRSRCLHRGLVLGLSEEPMSLGCGTSASLHIPGHFLWARLHTRDQTAAGLDGSLGGNCEINCHWDSGVLSSFTGTLIDWCWLGFVTSGISQVKPETGPCTESARRDKKEAGNSMLVGGRFNCQCCQV